MKIAFFDAKPYDNRLSINTATRQVLNLNITKRNLMKIQ